MSGLGLDENLVFIHLVNAPDSQLPCCYLEGTCWECERLETAPFYLVAGRFSSEKVQFVISLSGRKLSFGGVILADFAMFRGTVL